EFLETAPCDADSRRWTDHAMDLYGRGPSAKLRRHRVEQDRRFRVDCGNDAFSWRFCVDYFKRSLMSSTTLRDEASDHMLKQLKRKDCLL
ncbi:unnamed protein product, partial [Amoebophrya sp. A120]